MGKVGAALVGFAAMPLFGGPGAAGPLRLLALDQFRMDVGGYLRAVSYCDAFGCAPGTAFGVYGELSNYDVTYGQYGPLPQYGYLSYGYTDGGLKDTEVVGFQRMRLFATRGDAGAGFTVDAASNVTLTIGGDLYSAALETSVDVRVEFSLVGLPNDRFVRSGGGSVQPSSEYGVAGGVEGSLLTPGAFEWRGTASDSYFYECPVCPRNPLREAGGDGARGGATVNVASSVFASPSFSLADESQWLQFDGGLAARAWVIQPIEGGSRLLVAGIFEQVGGDPIVRVTSWSEQDGWRAYGSGTNGGVRAAVEWNGGLVIGGGFTRAGGQTRNRVAFWDGDSWEALGEGFNGVVRALEVVDGELIAGGEFTMSGGDSVAHLARWLPAEQRWQQVLGVNGPVLAMHQPEDPFGFFFGDDALVIGGEFTVVDGSTARGVAIVESITSDFPYGYGLDGGVQGIVNTIASDTEWDDTCGAYSPRLYVGGVFSQVGSPVINASNVARFDWCQYTWRAMGTGVNDNVNDIHVYDSDAGVTRGLSGAEPWGGSVVIVGGDFTQAGGAPAARIARWDEGTWSPMGDGFNRFVSAIGMWQDEVIASGKFDATGAFNAQHLARWTLEDPPAPSCPGDASGDGVVDFSDLNAVLVAFGESGAPGFSPADLNGDGAVDFSDLNAVLVAFGTSCD